MQPFPKSQHLTSLAPRILHLQGGHARCTGCGGKGATLKHSTWGGNSIGFMPFPIDN
jgi:hypothetical protein